MKFAAVAYMLLAMQAFGRTSATPIPKTHREGQVESKEKRQIFAAAVLIIWAVELSADLFVGAEIVESAAVAVELSEAGAYTLLDEAAAEAALEGSDLNVQGVQLVNQFAKIGGTSVATDGTFAAGVDVDLGAAFEQAVLTPRFRAGSTIKILGAVQESEGVAVLRDTTIGSASGLVDVAEGVVSFLGAEIGTAVGDISLASL